MKEPLELVLSANIKGKAHFEPLIGCITGKKKKNSYMKNIKETEIGERFIITSGQYSEELKRIATFAFDNTIKLNKDFANYWECF